MDGQAEGAPVAGGLDELASFLADTPARESVEDDEAASAGTDTAAPGNQPGDGDTQGPANSEQDDVDPDSPDADASQEADGEGDDSADDTDPASAAKITLKIKGEDGKEETIEATPEELAQSYMRQADYTRKTQALAQREAQVVEFLSKKHEETVGHYLGQAKLVKSALVNFAGLKSADEMAQLAQSDPAAWVAENQRQQSFGSFVGQLDAHIQAEEQAQAERAQKAQADAIQSMRNAYAKNLLADGIDRQRFEHVYGTVSKEYGFSEQELGNVFDHRLFRMMKDAAAYRALQQQKGVVTQKAQAAKGAQGAPRIQPRNNQGAQDRAKDQALAAKFKSGRAKLNDLVAYLA